MKYVLSHRLYLEGDTILLRSNIPDIDQPFLDMCWKDPIVPDVFDTKRPFNDISDENKRDVVHLKSHGFYTRPEAPESMRQLAKKITLIACPLSTPDIQIGLFVMLMDWDKKLFHTRSYLTEKYRQQGKGKEMKILSFEFAFEELLFDKVCSGVIRPTRNNMRTNIGCGMESVNVVLHHFMVHGRAQDSVDFEMRKEKWREYLEFCQTYNVKRAFFERLENENGFLSRRKEQNRLSCIQIARILCSLPKRYG